MITIERASSEHLREVVPLFEKYRAFYRCDPAQERAESFLRERLEKGESVIFVARDVASAPAKAVGFVQLYPLFSSTAMKRLWLLNDLFVEESQRGVGIGERLIVAGTELARSTQARGLFLETEPSNQRAHRLYEKMGFELVGNLFYGLEL